MPDHIADRTDLERQQAIDYIHGVIGIATEAGELLEGLRDVLRGKSMDAVKVEEEVGDAKWYMAILARTFGFLWGNDERKNIAKLRARFPDKFTEYDANNRNLAVEREILEDKPKPGDSFTVDVDGKRYSGTFPVDIAMQQRRGPIGDCEGMDC